MYCGGVQRQHCQVIAQIRWAWLYLWLCTCQRVYFNSMLWQIQRWTRHSCKVTCFSVMSFSSVEWLIYEQCISRGLALPHPVPLWCALTYDSISLVLPSLSGDAVSSLPLPQFLLVVTQHSQLLPPAPRALLFSFLARSLEKVPNKTFCFSWLRLNIVIIWLEYRGILRKKPSP